MTYRVTEHFQFREPSAFSKNSDMHPCRAISFHSYEVNTKEDCLDVLKSILDAPEKEMAFDDARKEFEDLCIGKLDDKVLESICSYYNGRLKLQEKVLKDVEELGSTVKILRYDIPAKLSAFNVYYDSHCVHECAYIEIEALDSPEVKL